MSSTTLTARNATADDLVRILQEQKARKLDVVVPATSMRSKNGLVQVKNADPVISEDGVTSTTGSYRPTAIFDEGLSAKLEIPRAYLRRLRDSGRTDLIDGNVNGLLHGRTRKIEANYADPSLPSGERQAPGNIVAAHTEVIHQPDDRAFLLRLFKGDEPGSEGVARAMLSDRYGITMDNLDILTAVMDGIQAAGQKPVVRVTDLSERAMRVRFEFPDRNATAPGLAGGYRSPFDGGAVTRAGAFDQMRQQYGAHHIFSDKDAPMAFLGFDLRNSETGGGAYTLSPVVEIVKCTNGWTLTKEGIRKVHLGARLQQGNVQASAETARRAGALVVSETTDAVSQWLSEGWLEGQIAALTDKASKEITSASTTVPAIVTGLGFSDDEAKGVLDLFILSGQPTAGGIANAVSAFAQTVEDVDRAYEIELATVPALEAAAAA
jgi:hypothetical protein